METLKTIGKWVVGLVLVFAFAGALALAGTVVVSAGRSVYLAYQSPKTEAISKASKVGLSENTSTSVTPSVVPLITPEEIRAAAEDIKAQLESQSAITGTVVMTDAVIAGGDFLAIKIETLEDGWSRLVEPTNSNPPAHPEYCAWSFQFKMQVSEGVQVQFPHCVELRATGTGTIEFEVRPDDEGYDTSNISGEGLAWWPSGVNGTYDVSYDGGLNWKGTSEGLTTGPEGISMPNRDGYTIKIRFTLEDGFVTAPLGEIRNNVLPMFHP